MKLRDYELEWIQRIKASKSQRVLIVGPTGCGKTVVAVSLIREAIQRHGRVLFLAHRVELINQAKQRLVDHGVEPIDVGTIRAGEPENRGARIQVASVQTLARREKPPAELVFIDEAHHASAVSYRKILESYPDALVFGLTATPYRLDGKPLGDLFEEIVESAKPSALIEAGWIMRPRVWTVPIDERPDLAGVSMSGGDFNLGELDRAARRKGLVGNIVDHWKRLAENRPTVCYAVSVRHGQQIRDAFRSSGVKAELLTGETKDKDRAVMLRRLGAGETSVVVNCMVLTEGWDCPEARCAIVARPTMSQSLWFQMAGRVMRKGDVEPIILDHAGNALMHPIPGTDIEHSLSEAQKKPRKPGQMKEKTCGDCGSSMPLGCRVCPNCGYEFWTGEPPEEVLGELREFHTSADHMSNEEASLAARMYESGSTLKSISAALQWDAVTIKRAITSLGVKLRDPVELRLKKAKQAVELVKCGVAPVVAASKIGADRKTVYSLLDAIGYSRKRMPRVSRRISDVERASIVEMYKSGESINGIATIVGINACVVATVVNRSGIPKRSLSEAMGGLSEAETEAAVSSYINGTKCPAIAVQLGKSKDTVRTAILRKLGKKTLSEVSSYGSK